MEKTEKASSSDSSSSLSDENSSGVKSQEYSVRVVAYYLFSWKYKLQVTSYNEKKRCAIKTAFSITQI